MCGISGIVSHKMPILEGIIERMVGTLEHRGPDAQDCVRLQACHLGHNRLSIIDLAGGSQPMSIENERYWITFNGEIFNYRELRETLKKRGVQFKTNSDTEVLLRAYQHFGVQTPEYLNGQFAFAIWDNVERVLFIARDRLGEKPLFWAQSSDGLYTLFASEIKTILGSGLLTPRIDPASIDAYLALLYIPPEKTVYKNISALPPAHAALWREGQVSIWRYWDLHLSTRQGIDESEAVEHINFLMSQAVKRQMVADVPIGAFLSGGLDSSTIVALMSKHSQRVKTFSAGFGDHINELPYARLVATQYATEHHEIQINIPLTDMLERMSEVYDEPFADSSNIPTFLISGFARQHVKVVLSGDGGDELFGGYAWYGLLLNDAELDSDSASVLSAYMHYIMVKSLVKLGQRPQSQVGTALQKLSRIKTVRRYRQIWERHIAFSDYLNGKRAALWGSAAHIDGLELLRETYKPKSLGLDGATEFDLRCYLPGDILVKVDRASMAHGLETRAPMLDVDLVEFVLSLPTRIRFKDKRLKYLLRASFQNLWADAIKTRSKQGFGAPINAWMAKPEMQIMMKRVCAATSPLISLLPGVKTAVKALSPYQQWIVLCLGLWLERHSEAL
jgi:asparagine synthase (glutamine-hydrolysing)